MIESPDFFYYTGIGSRNTPPDIIALMQSYANRLKKLGYVLRSGGADGADKAFESGAGKLKIIFLPWKGFNNSNSRFFNIDESAITLASTLHKGWDWLKPGAKKLMARNCYQVLGSNLNLRSEFVICWTPDGCESDSTRSSKTGGTGQAISLAENYNIPIFNLFNYESINKLNTFLDTLERELE